jgi:hypothetical protein
VGSTDYTDFHGLYIILSTDYTDLHGLDIDLSTDFTDLLFCPQISQIFTELILLDLMDFYYIQKGRS